MLKEVDNRTDSQKILDFINARKSEKMTVTKVSKIFSNLHVRKVREILRELLWKKEIKYLEINSILKHCKSKDNSLKVKF